MSQITDVSIKQALALSTFS